MKMNANGGKGSHGRSKSMKRGVAEEEKRYSEITEGLILNTHK